MKNFFTTEARHRSNFIKTFKYVLVHNKLVKFYFEFLIIFFIEFLIIQKKISLNMFYSIETNRKWSTFYRDKNKKIDILEGLKHKTRTKN